MDDNVVDTRKQFIDKKAKELERAAAASEFVNSKGGQNLLDWCNAQITQFTNELLSDKFLNDHNGYLDARAKVSVLRNVVTTLSKQANPDLEAALRKQIEEASSDA